MEKIPRVRFIVITILVVTLVNVIAMAFIVRFTIHEHRRESSREKKEFARSGFDFLKEKLQLTPQQEQMFKNERDSFFASANLIFDDLEAKRMSMIREFGKAEPDTTVLFRIADSMGVDHGQLKRRVVLHFLKLRSYCTPAQVVKLDSMYNYMIRSDSPWRRKSQDSQHKDRR